MGAVVNHPKWYVSVDRLRRNDACVVWRSKWRQVFGDGKIVLTKEIILHLLNTGFPLFGVADKLWRARRVSLDQMFTFEAIVFSRRMSNKQKANLLYNFIQRL